MKIIIRLDDITPDMNWEKVNKAKSIFDKYDVKPLIGVVPENRDETLHCIGDGPNATVMCTLAQGEDGSHGDGSHGDGPNATVMCTLAQGEASFWNELANLKSAGWQIAQHGTYHVYETEDSGLLGINPFSEFAGLPYEAQYEKLLVGRNILLSHGIHTDIFMAPGHTYDMNTIKALKELGFSYITDGLYSEPYDIEGITCVPCRLQAWDKLTGLDTICLHTNLMDDEDFDKLDEFIKNHKEEIIEFDGELFASQAVPYTLDVKKAEQKVLEKRKQKDKVAKNARLSWYLSYTNHPNSKIKWLKRGLMLPLLLTNKYKKNN